MSIARDTAIEWFDPVYRLADDEATIAAVRRATVESEPGIVPEHGLFGSPAWWAAIDDGRLPLVEKRGIISAVDMNGTDDRPTFAMLDESGAVSGWQERRANDPRREALYQTGRRIVQRTVTTRSQVDGMPQAQTVVVETWLSSSTRLFRPVGPSGLQLIVEAGFAAFPPRLPEQPIFYPVCESDYAREIAERWNVPESSSGYVTAFDVDARYLARYDVRQAGGRNRREYWIPADDLAEFNAHIIGDIAVIESFGTSV